MSESPFTFAEARRAANTASQRQAAAEDARKDAALNLAAKDRVYRQAKARKIVELHSEGVAWTVADTIASGDPVVSTAKFEMAIAAGVLAVCEQSGFRLGADRRSLEKLTEWSMRRELAENGGRG